MRFSFKAKNVTGQIREGIVEAIDSNAAADILRHNVLTPISLTAEERTSSFFKNFQKIWEGVSQRELVALFQQLATLVEARVPIVSSLHTIEEQTRNRYLQIVLKEMADDIEDGVQFSTALEKHPDVFSPLIVHMLKAGEVSGELQKAIQIVAENVEKNYQLTSKIKGALYYPTFVLGVAFIIGFLVVTFILPKITVMVKELNVPIPWYTSALIWLGDFMNAYWWAVLIALIAAVGGLIYYIRTESGRLEWQSIVLKIPVIGTLARNIYITRFSENLGTLLNAGIPVVRALTIVSEVIGNQVFEKIVLRAADEVRSGGTMSTVFLHTPEMPPIVAQMIRIGEETGSLANVLTSTSKFYNQEVELTTKNLTTLIEPILIVFLGIGVGILVVGVLLPIYNIAGQL